MMFPTISALWSRSAPCSGFLLHRALVMFACLQTSQFGSFGRWVNKLWLPHLAWLAMAVLISIPVEESLAVEPWVLCQSRNHRPWGPYCNSYQVSRGYCSAKLAVHSAFAKAFSWKHFLFHSLWMNIDTKRIDQEKSPSPSPASGEYRFSKQLFSRDHVCQIICFRPPTWIFVWTHECSRFLCIFSEKIRLGSEWLVPRLNTESQQCQLRPAKRFRPSLKLCAQALPISAAASLQLFRKEFVLWDICNSWQYVGIRVSLCSCAELPTLCLKTILLLNATFTNSSWMLCGLLSKTWQILLRTVNYKRCSSAVVRKIVLTLRWSLRNQASKLLHAFGFLRSGLITCLSPQCHQLEVSVRFRMDSFLRDSMNSMTVPRRLDPFFHWIFAIAFPTRFALGPPRYFAQWFSRSCRSPV